MFSAWRIFRWGKTGKTDVMNFEMNLEDNIFRLSDEIKHHAYKHSPYGRFQIFDNKKRDIYKAEVRDRIVHKIIFDYLLLLFEPTFISDSYASRINKGQYKAINALRYFVGLESDRRGACYVLKCDIKKYFDSVDHDVLLGLIKMKVSDEKIFEIIKEIVSSYHSFLGAKKGIPLGNVTSQIFANIYLNALDAYAKKELRCRFYVRYNDDFAIVSRNKKLLEETRDKIIVFTKKQLLLEIPIKKTSIRKIAWGVDFLGFTILPEAILLRNKTKNKIYSNINQRNMQSYLGILKHCDSYYLKRKLLFLLDKQNEIW